MGDELSAKRGSWAKVEHDEGEDEGVGLHGISTDRCGVWKDLT